jgi:hypothetical protein
VLGIIFRRHNRVLSHSSIAAELYTTYGMKFPATSVKGIIARLVKRNIIKGWQAREGMNQGNHYTFTQELLCPHIKTAPPGTLPGAPASTLPATQAQLKADNTILEQSERINLSNFSGESTSRRLLEALTEDDISFHWPSLAKEGFGTVQIRQFLTRLGQAGLSVQRVLESLRHAEWALTHSCMRDGDGGIVRTPLNWVFKIIAKEGYYPRPEGYISPQEQAERDAEVEAKRRTTAIEARIDAECQAWLLTLSPEDVQSILPNAQVPFGKSARDALLRAHFREHVWPKILVAKQLGQPTPCAHGALSGAGRGLCPSEPREDEGQEPEA